MRKQDKTLKIGFSHLLESDSEERANTELIVTIGLIGIGLTLVAGLGSQLLGVTDDLLPGPSGEADIEQHSVSGEPAVDVTLLSVEDGVEAVGVDVQGADEDDFELEDNFAGTSSPDTDSVNSEFAFEDDGELQAGSTMRLTEATGDFEEGQVVTVVAYEEGSDSTEEMSSFELGPTS